jgi:hypothetical protein
MQRRTYLIVLLVLALIAVGVSIGIMLPRLSWVGTAFRSSPTALAAGIQLEELKSAEELFALAGQKAVVIKYSRGDVEFWVEIESQGKKEKLGQELASLCSEQAPGADQTVEGYFLLVRSAADDSGRETWWVACQRDLVTADSAGAQVSTPLAQANVSQSREDRQSKSASSSQPVQVWESTKGQGRNRVRAPEGPPATDKLEAEISSLRKGPLTTGQEVCIKEIRGNRKKENEFVRVYTIKVMCKAVSAIP